MIPKVIHYCWFGGKPLPASARRCIRSWKTHCAGWQIKEWNETNFDVSPWPYAAEALAQKKYAFVTDLVRLAVLYKEGGVYMDTDVELIASIDDLLTGDGYMGFEADPDSAGTYHVATGLGMAVRPGHPLIAALLADYDGAHFVLPDGSLDTTACTVRNAAVLERFGLKPDNTEQILQGIRILPSDRLCPMAFTTGELHLTPGTRSIHHYDMSWMTARERCFRCYQHMIAKMKRTGWGRALIRLKKKFLPKSIGT